MRKFIANKTLCGILVAFLVPAASFAQGPLSPYRDVEQITLSLDRGDVWTLHFAYVPTRIISVDIPGKGRKQVWYMIYKVWNLSDAPQTFEPKFELVTKDGELRTFVDEPQPFVVKKIKEIEDPNDALDFKTSFTINKNRIPLSKKENAIPRAVYGVAVWLDVPEKAAACNNFSVYITGLSNGRSVSEPVGGGEEEIRLKTLQLDFIKPTDPIKPRQDDIRTNENSGLGSSKWIYRAIPAKKPEVEKVEKK